MGYIVYLLSTMTLLGADCLTPIQLWVRSECFLCSFHSAVVISHDVWIYYTISFEEQLSPLAYSVFCPFLTNAIKKISGISKRSRWLIMFLTLCSFVSLTYISETVFSSFICLFKTWHFSHKNVSLPKDVFLRKESE